MKKILLVITLMVASFSNAQNLTAQQFIDVAGKQRMLSQKIAKNFLIMAYAEWDNNFNLPSKVKVDYKVGISVFKRNLEMLSNNTDINKTLLSLLKEERESWETLEKALNKEKIAKNVNECVALANDLLLKSNNVVVEAEKKLAGSGDVNLLKLINKSGKQRMLSQRLCLFFMNHKIQNFLPKKEKGKLYDIESVFNKMDTDIGDLLVSPYNNEAATNEKIGEVSVEFDNLKDKKEVFVNGHLEIEEVFEVTNNLTKLFNDLTFAYTKVK